MSKSPTLRLDGIIPALEEDTELYEHIDKRALAYMDDIGVKLPEQLMANGEPLIPSIPKSEKGPTLDLLDKQGLSNLHAQLVAYLQYTSTQLGILEIRREALKKKLELTEAKIMLLLPPPEVSKKTRARVDKRVVELEEKSLEEKAKYILLSKIVSGIDSELKVVSREITLRDGEMDAIRRNENIGRKPKVQKGVSGGWRRG